MKMGNMKTEKHENTRTREQEIMVKTPLIKGVGGICMN